MRLRACLLPCCSFGAALLAAQPAQAIETQIDATFAAQYYSLRSPYGNPLVARRRYTQTLSLDVYDIQGERTDRGPLLSFRSRVRLDADFGQRDEERSADLGAAYVPGLSQAPFDLMYGYLEGQRYLRGMLGFRLGRQYVIDSLGFWSFDGAEVELTLPAYFAIEGYAGFEQRGGLPMLATSRFEADGVSRGRRSGLAFDQSTPYLEESKLAPAYGIALETAGLHFLHSRLTYRKVINRDTVLISPFREIGQTGQNGGYSYVGGDRTSSERVGYSLRADQASLGAVSGALVYDLYNQGFGSYDLALDWYTTQKLTLGAALDYFKPMFDADSIFNWFVHDGTTTYSGRAELALTRDAELVGTGGVRMYTTEGAVKGYASGHNLNQTGRSYDQFGTLGGRYRYGVGSVALNSMLETGTIGHRYGGDATARRLFDGGYYDSLLILSLYDWRDALRPDRSATSFSYVLGGGVSPLFLGSRGRLGVEWEHTMNHLVGQRFRVLATLDFTVLK